MSSISNNKPVKPLTFDYVLGKFEKYFCNKTLESSLSKLTEKFLYRYSVQDFEKFSRDFAAKVQEKSLFSKYNPLALMVLLPAMEGASKSWLSGANMIAQITTISKLIQENKLVEALQETGNISEEYHPQRERWFKTLAVKFLNQSDFGNAAKAIENLEQSVGKELLITRCPGYKTQNSTQFTLSNVLEVFKQMAPEGINNSNVDQLTSQVEALSEKWASDERYSLKDFEELKKAVLQEEKRINRLGSSQAHQQYIHVIKSLADGLIFAKKVSHLVETKKYRELFEHIKNSDLAETVKNEHFTNYFIAAMNEKDFETATLAFSYLPDGPEKLQLAFQYSFEHVKKEMQPILGNIELPLNVDQNFIDREWDKKQKQMNALMSFSLEELQDCKTELELQLPQLAAEKDSAMQNSFNEAFIKQKLDAFFDAQEKLILIQGAIKRKMDDKPEEKVLSLDSDSDVENSSQENSNSSFEEFKKFLAQQDSNNNNNNAPVNTTPTITASKEPAVKPEPKKSEEKPKKKEKDGCVIC